MKHLLNLMILACLLTGAVAPDPDPNPKPRKRRVFDYGVAIPDAYTQNTFQMNRPPPPSPPPVAGPSRDPSGVPHSEKRKQTGAEVPGRSTHGKKRKQTGTKEPTEPRTFSNVKVPPPPPMPLPYEWPANLPTTYNHKHQQYEVKSDECTHIWGTHNDRTVRGCLFKNAMYKAEYDGEAHVGYHNHARLMGPESRPRSKHDPEKHGWLENLPEMTGKELAYSDGQTRVYSAMHEDGAITTVTKKFDPNIVNETGRMRYISTQTEHITANMMSTHVQKYTMKPNGVGDKYEEIHTYHHLHPLVPNAKYKETRGQDIESRHSYDHYVPHYKPSGQPSPP